MRKIKLLASVAGLTAAVALTGAAQAAAADGGALTPAYGTIDPFSGDLGLSYGTIDPFYGTIDPFYGTIDPFYGTIDPFYGTIDPFYGTIDPFYGTIDPFYGTIDPFYGTIDPFYGTIDPFYGTIDPFYGTIDPFYGTIDPFYGTIDPFYGTIDPFYGTIDPFYGTIDPFYGTIDPFYGTIDPFYGTIDPFYGTIDPFYGTIDPFYGTIDPFYGTIDPFYGTIDPFYGTIDPFYGTIDPFYGTIDPFYGTIDPFYGTIDPFYGTIDPFYGTIDPFYGTIDPFYGTIDPFSGDANRFFKSVAMFWADLAPIWKGLNQSWAQADSDAEFKRVARDLVKLIARSEATWEKSVYVRTGETFWDGFAKGMLEEYGIDLADPSSLANLDAADRARFLLAWHDGLISFGNFDHLDRWMPMINWSPAMTAYGDATPVVGLLDTAISSDPDLAGKLLYSGGYDFNNGHGSAVGGLIAGSIDGRGVMGVAPGASLVHHNPFDDTGTASWEDVREGLRALGENGASVVNISMGESDTILSEEWADIFADPQIQASLGESVFVKAAGNDGVRQTADIDWNFDADIELLLVGSVDPLGRISSFSNTPGEACLLDGGVCEEENKLKYRYLVAPGELILSSDGEGGVQRFTGTSLAAPLVTGAVALLHQRWPWLSGHAAESADIILQSATDLGRPGVDPVYGWGLLNVAASQAPLDIRDLVFYESGGEAGEFHVSDAGLTSLVNGGAHRSNWDGDAVIHAFEPVGETYRDFEIPVSALTVSQSFRGRGAADRFQSYIDHRMNGFTSAAGFSDVTTVSEPIAGEGMWTLRMTASNRAPDEVLSRSTLPFQTGVVMTSPDRDREFRFGHGEGAIALSSRGGFGVFSDYDGETGGVNPVLGLASGGLYFGGASDIGERVRLKFGATQQTNEHIYINPISGAEEPLLAGLQDYQAGAVNVGADFLATERLTFGASYTRLYEDTGVLGVQGLGPLDLAGGASTDAATFDARYAFNHGVDLSASATLARTDASSVGGGAFALDGGVVSSAFALAVTKTGVLGGRDRLRFSLAQPMHVEAGSMEYASVQVVDRETGELGLVSERFDMGGSRDYVFEALYALPVLQGAGEIAAFGRAEMADASFARERSGVAFGARFGLDF